MSRKRLVTFAVVAVCGAFGVLVYLLVCGFWASETWSRITHRSQHHRTYETVLRPTADWVRTFQKREGRLPKDKEVQSYAETRFPDLAVGVFSPRFGKSARADVDFEIYVHIDDWNLYYDSWDGQEWNEWTD